MKKELKIDFYIVLNEKVLWSNGESHKIDSLILSKGCTPDLFEEKTRNNEKPIQIGDKQTTINWPALDFTAEFQKTRQKFEKTIANRLKEIE